MSNLPCVTCVDHGRCHRTVGKSGGRCICGDYNPVRCCSNCKWEGMQLVARNCIGCVVSNVTPAQYNNFELRT